MRVLAERFSAWDPDLLALSEVDDGDALALATRFDRQWAYRGGQALLWRRRFEASGVHGRYLPAVPLQPFERRGLLHVDGTLDGTALTVFSTRFTESRDRVRDLRRTRSWIRASHSERIVLCITNPPAADAFRDLGFEQRADRSALDALVATRGLWIESSDMARAAGGLGMQLALRIRA
jgi:hypothetical protein